MILVAPKEPYATEMLEQEAQDDRRRRNRYPEYTSVLYTSHAWTTTVSSKLFSFSTFRHLDHRSDTKSIRCSSDDQSKYTWVQAMILHICTVTSFAVITVTPQCILGRLRSVDHHQAEQDLLYIDRNTGGRGARVDRRPASFRNASSWACCRSTCIARGAYSTSRRYMPGRVTSLRCASFHRR